VYVIELLNGSSERISQQRTKSEDCCRNFPNYLPDQFFGFVFGLLVSVAKTILVANSRFGKTAGRSSNHVNRAQIRKFLQLPTPDSKIQDCPGALSVDFASRLQGDAEAGIGCAMNDLGDLLCEFGIGMIIKPEMRARNVSLEHAKMPGATNFF